MVAEAVNLQFDYSRYGFRQEERYVYKAPKGLNERIVRELSGMKGEPEWMLKRRLRALEIFNKKPTPLVGTWANPELAELNYDDIHYFVRANERPQTDWDAVPPEIKNTFERLGIPEAERKFLAGVGAQYESEVVYHSLREEWAKQGVIFLDTDTALKEYPEFFKEYFGTIVPAADNKYAALNTAVWSGGSFVYVPKGVKVDIPLQAYFRINAERMGQFERTLIIIDEGAEAHYIEGCTAPIYSTNSLHSAVVEVIVKKGGKFRYTTIQNWANNIFNLVTKRAVAYEEASMEWVDGNIGSKLTMKYPSVYLMGRKARGEVLSVAYAGRGQHQDAGAKMIHLAPETTSRITNKSVSKDGGKTTYRGLAKVAPGAYGAKINVNCDALILDEHSASDTIPYIEIEEDRCTLAHEATVGRIGAEQLFYLMSRGISESDALSMIVLGFMEPFTRELPMEYAVELNRLIQLEMEGSVG
ncbi:MAG TPA: Fe-S cluster assembly protein SufB [Chloroflexus aurantiacus]|uniref:FeS assembly protein SufB n=1 Tax=Chloroflexus aurantiacus (strain ATCC 29366 / DSM 635 / J-10-fl) TaxID=324602 RepID=A9W9Y7_CHLAA|nr:MULTISPECIES: Fe-S cluster assembly protein SufB [Chloroflexus]ABY36669.1 FeS assembly protein SufB [Chloroflexus aurantiacus J-10-fl]RMG53198.1 MAG: Fe-S cluster assembly protein SufB [Chloroflexota bacterium]GIV94444.1 MAG: Fe-S cluster assembly protein SufB [Chloroflexus sp.]HBW67679.1 Fe-S cluster assembly protein SufB [Chloroflexus aurantiacus]